MNDTDYVDALRLLDRATTIMRSEKATASPDGLAYELRRLIIAFDTWRVQVGQPPPELQRN